MAVKRLIRGGGDSMSNRSHSSPRQLAVSKPDEHELSLTPNSDSRLTPEILNSQNCLAHVH